MIKLKFIQTVTDQYLFSLRMFLCVSFILLPSYVLAESVTDFLSEELSKKSEWGPIIKPAIKIGIGLTNAVIESGFSRKDLSYNPDLNIESKAILESVDNRFQEMERKQIGIDLLAANTELVVETVSMGLVVGSGGALAIAEPLVGKVTMMAIEKISERIKENYEETAINFMLSKEKEIIAVTGKPIENLIGAEEKKLEKVFDQVDIFNTELDQRTDGLGKKVKDKTKDLANKIMIETLKNVDRQIFKQLKEQNSRIDNVQDRFVKLVETTDKFMTTTTERLETHSKLLTELDKSVKKLSNDVGKVNATLKEHGKSIAFLSDFAFSKMSASEKAEALKNGMFSEKFICNPKNEECNSKEKSEAKKNLIAQYESEAKVQKITNKVLKYSRDIGNLASIATDLGINIPVLNDAAKFSSAVSNAIVAFYDPNYLGANYLGAVASVTSLFSKRSDPAAERQKQLMSFLAQHFEVLNGKLDAIIKNQEKIQKSIQDLANQSYEQYVALDERLAYLTFETQIASEGIKIVMREKWQDCYAVYNRAAKDNRSDKRYRLNRDNNDFVNIDGAFLFIKNAGYLIKECIQHADTQLRSLSNITTFGNFLSLKFALEQITTKDLNLESSKKYYKASDVEVFLRTVHLETLQLINTSPGFLADNWLSVFIESAYPDLYLSNQRLSNLENQCATDRIGLSIKNLICETDNEGRVAPRITIDKYPNYAAQLLQEPADIGLMEDLSNWLLLASRLEDLSVNDGFYFDKFAFLSDMSKDSNIRPRGIALLEEVEQVLEYAIASRAVVYSKPILDAADAALRSTDLERYKRAFSLLKSNPYLLHNLATKTLYEGFQHAKLNNQERLLPWTHRFATAVIAEDPNHDTEPFASLFKSESFYLIKYSKEKSWPEFCVKAPEGNPDMVCTSVPGPDALLTGKLELPPSIYRLVAKRHQIRQRLFQYDSLQDLRDDQIESLTAVLAY